MKKQVNQWFAVYDEIFRTDDNTNRYCALWGWSLRHYGTSFSVNGIKKNGKLLYMATLEVQDNEEYFKEFCDMADKVNGLYCVSDIIDFASKVLEKL